MTLNSQRNDIEQKKLLKGRLEKHYKAAKRKLTLAKEKGIQNESEISERIKFIIHKILGFSQKANLIDIPNEHVDFNCLGIKFEDEIKYIINSGPPTIELQNINLDNLIEYAISEKIKRVVRTNGIEWEIYQSNYRTPNKYDRKGAFNFLNFDINNDDNLSILFLLSNEGQAKIRTDKYNRLRWWGYLSDDKSNVEFMILINITCYEDGSEKVYIPLLDITYWSDELFLARRYAEKKVQEYLHNEFNKLYDKDHTFETTAFHKENEHIKRNRPVWW